ncbi:MAG: FG-GAP-like repeat-containing protein [bacterium]
MKKNLFFSRFFLICITFTAIQSLKAQQLIASFIEQNEIGNSSFGISVSNAGDVNNDGYDDIIIGARYYHPGGGRAYVYLGGTSMDNIADVTMTGEQNGGFFGGSVSNAGDVNNDGYDDIIVGASFGRVYIYYGGSSMDNIADVTMIAENENDIFGVSVSGAADLNNDSYSDVIVGAYGYSNYTGRAYIYYGGSNMDNTADVIMTGKNVDDRFGLSVSNAGDVNNDGFDDVIVGASRYLNSTGRVYIYYGGEPMDNGADVIMTGEETYNYFGSPVSDAGDVNNDGYADVIVDAYSYLNYTGRTYIFLGGELMDNTPDIVMTGGYMDERLGGSLSASGDINNDGFDDVILEAKDHSRNMSVLKIYYGGNSMDNTPDITLTGEGETYWNDIAVSGAGDVNNDGYADVIIGDYNFLSTTGRALIFYGGTSIDNIADIQLTGEGTENGFGSSVSGAGDVNNDGFNDVIVGAQRYLYLTGRVYIYYGGESMDANADVIMTGENKNDKFGITVSGIGDLNNDGFDDVIIGSVDYSDFTGRAYIYFGGSSMDNTADITLTGEGPNCYFSAALSSAGDINNDGFNDVIIGAPGYSDYTGRAYIYYGSSNIDNTEDLTITGHSKGNLFGYSVSDAGDVNNDGIADVIVGAYGYSNLTGRAYIYFGGESMDNTVDVTLAGEEIENYFGCSVSSAKDVNNDGFDDVIIGAYGNSEFTGRAYVYLGGNSMDNAVDVTITGESVNNRFGSSVSQVGDINNDGFNDIIIGAYGYSDFTGRAYVYYGGESIDNISDITFTGEGEFNSFGYSLSSAGDVNNDGFDDFIIGADSYPTNGKAYIYCDNSAPVAVEFTSADTPYGFELFQNYPNPFNPVTIIKYSLPRTETVKLVVYDILGNKIAVLLDEEVQPGTHEVNFDGSKLPSGVYICNLQAGGFSESKKLSLIK